MKIPLLIVIVITAVIATELVILDWQDRVRLERPCDVLWDKPYVCRHGAKNEDFRRAPNDYRGI